MIMIYSRHVAAIQEELLANQYTATGKKRRKVSEEENILIPTQTLLFIMGYSIFFNIRLLIGYEKVLSTHLTE